MKWKSYKDLPPGPIAVESTEGVNRTGGWRTSKPILDTKNCIRCTFCWKFCPEVAITFGDDGLPKVNYDYCKGCGICANECPKGCFKMVLEIEREVKADGC